MVLLLSLSLTLSLIALLGAAAMERAAILGRINGANGLTILVALIVSAAASLVVSLERAVGGPGRVGPLPLGNGEAAAGRLAGPRLAHRRRRPGEVAVALTAASFLLCTHKLAVRAPLC